MPRQLAIRNQSLTSAVYDIVVEGKIAVTDLFSIYPDAFVDLHEVRRSIEAGPRARSFQNRGQRRCGRPLSVCPRNEDSRNSQLRVIQFTEQYPHIGQIELLRGRLAQFVAKGVHPSNGVLIRHEFGHQPQRAVSLDWRATPKGISFCRRHNEDPTAITSGHKAGVPAGASS